MLNITKEEVVVALEAGKTVESINKETNENDERTIIDKFISEKDESESVVNKLAIKQLIGKLADREKEIIYLRYYKDKTQMQVAKILGITQVQVSRIEKKVLQQMRNKLVG